MSKKTITVNATNKAVNVKLITLFYGSTKYELNKVRQ